MAGKQEPAHSKGRTGRLSGQKDYVKINGT